MSPYLSLQFLDYNFIHSSLTPLLLSRNSHLRLSLLLQHLSRAPVLVPWAGICKKRESIFSTPMLQLFNGQPSAFCSAQSWPKDGRQGRFTTQMRLLKQIWMRKWTWSSRRCSLQSFALLSRVSMASMHVHCWRTQRWYARARLHPISEWPLLVYEGRHYVCCVRGWHDICRGRSVNSLRRNSRSWSQRNRTATFVPTLQRRRGWCISWYSNYQDWKAYFFAPTNWTDLQGICYSRFVRL